MATQTPQHIYSIEDVNLTRLSCIHQRVTTEVLRYVFQTGSSDRPHNMSLLDYYSSKGIDSTKFRNRLFKKQRTKVDIDFRGDTFDITLLYRCLRCGSHGLAQNDDEKWNKDDRTSIESLITIVKNKRNDLAHDQPKYTNLQLLNEVKDLKEIFIDILKYSGYLFHIPAATTDQEISNVEDSITKYLYDEFQPTTFEEYKEQLFFDAQSEFLNDDGLEETLNQYIKCSEDEVSTTNHLVDLSLPVEGIYTEMTLKGESGSGCDKSIEYKDVLEDESQNITDSVIVVNGPAGIGKTTFTKKMICDFIKKIDTMKGLLMHDHLFKAECRNTAIKSFVQMLHHRMPNTSKQFKAGDLEIIMLAQKVLIILDGLDELNEASAKLFEELLCLKKDFGITLVITTRPEKMQYIRNKLKSHQLKMKHIQLMGIPTEKMDEMVINYHREIIKKYSVTRDIQGLLKYLKETKHSLAELWRLPYNLSLVTILWMYDFMNVENISTAPELYREILRLYITKLKERLQSNETTLHSLVSELQGKIDFFLCSLAREALIGLINDHINLPQDAYERLARICRRIKIPIQEMIGAFLRRIPGADIIYSFAHKGIQDHLAAYYIWLNITGKVPEHDVQDTLDDVTVLLLQKNVSESVVEHTLRFLEGEMKKKPKKIRKIVRVDGVTLGPCLETSSFIHEILDKLHGSSEYDLAKFQNTFICLLGMFYSEEDGTDEDIKLEALMLLQDTGIRDRDDWITILTSVKCDEYVASFISKQPKILDGHIQITDSSVSAYVSLMKALKTPFKDAHKVKVDVNIKGILTDDAQELLQLINSHQINVENILMNENNSKEYVAILKDLKAPLKEAHMTNIDLLIKEEMVEINELLDHIKDKGFRIRTLELEEKKMPMDGQNLTAYNEAPRSLPTFSRDRGETSSINTEEERETLDVIEILREVARNPFAVHIKFYHDFKHPESTSTASEEALRNVFLRCPIEDYTGRMTPHLSIPASMKTLWLSVHDTSAYLQLRRFLDTDHQLSELNISANLWRLEVPKLSPLPGNLTGRPSLFLPDVRTSVEGRRASDMTKRLNPINGNKSFGCIYFPRLRLQGEEIKVLLSEMKDVNVEISVVLPTLCRPSSREVEEDLQQLAERTLHCIDIEWGKPDWAKAGTVHDMDSW